jgi:hypothetical protein
MALSAQTVIIKGKVLDSRNKKPLAFVNIISVTGNHGTVSDIDGKFTIRLEKDACCLKLSYIGYEQMDYKIDHSKQVQTILMSPKAFELEEVTVFPGINPAHRIINLVIENRDKNNPENLDEFSYVSYDKMILTADADSLMKKDTALLDSTERKVRKVLEKQDFFMMETVTERKYMKPKLNQENVLATKVSGFKNPVVVFMLSQIQSTSFYDEKINIINKNYINPISKGSTRRYFFLLEDTTYNDKGDTTFIISYRPKLNSKFDGLKGFLYINSDGWAIQNVKAEPSKDTTGLTIQIQQSYEQIEGQWFPIQLNTDIIFTNMKMAAGKHEYAMIAHGNSYLRDINLHPGLKKRDFGFHEVEVEADAIKKKEDFWNKYRTDTLTDRERETYRVIDSIGEETDFDKYANTVQSLMTGAIPWGPIDIDIDKFFHYNNYEGFYAGLGIHTNQQLSKVVKFGGFWGYGFHDKTAKYGADISVVVHKRSESTLKFDYYFNVLPGGGTSFFTDQNQIWNTSSFGEFFTKRMNITRGFELSYKFRIRAFRDFKWNVALIKQTKKAFEDYIFTPFNPSSTPQTYELSKANLEFRFAWHEKVIQTTKGSVSFGSDYPVVWFKYTQSFKDLLNGDFNYSKVDLRILHTIKTNYYGHFTWLLNGGITNGEAPAPELYSAQGTYAVFTVFAPYTFGTMRANEFLSDRYASLFLTWDFRDLLISIGKWKPQLLLLTNVTFGTLKHPEQHLNYDFKTPDKGYYESGIVIRKLLNLQVYDLGLGVMYRYGPYGLPKVGDNFAYKISLFYAF